MKRLMLAALSLCLFAAAAFAQSNTGRLTGTVSDPSGVVPGATVEVTDNATNKTQTVTTSGEGSFTVPQLEVGTYTVKVSAPGHKTFTATNLKIDVGAEYSLPVTLEAGDVSANVTVVAGADIVNSSSGELNNTVSPRQVQELPLNGRNPLSLLTLQPGTASNQATNTSVNGQRPSFTNITRDGLNIQDNFIRSNASDFSPERPSVDNTAEFTVTTQNAGADRGYGASQIQLVTPRGANEFHGAGFEYNRNSAFGANSFFNNLNGTKKPFRNRNQFGGRVGGPIVKNKLFFFAFYEGVRDIRTSNQTRTVLTNNARQGLFTFNATCTASGSTACPAGVTPGQAVTVNLFGLSQGTAANPITAIDPLIASRFLANIPTGNRTDIGDQRNTTGFGFVQGQNLTRNQFTTRIDYDINDRNSINGVYTWTNENNLRPDVDLGGSGFLVGGGGFSFTPETVQPAPNRFLALAYRMSPTATFTNELRGGFYKSSPTFNRSTAEPNFFVSLPTIGGSQLGNPEVIFEDQGRFTKYYNIQDNAEYIRGDHSMRFGAQGQFFKINPFGPLAYQNTLVPTFTLGTNANTPQFSTSTFTPLGGISSSQLTDANALLAFLGGIVSSGSVAFNATSTDSGFVKGATPNRLLKTENYSFYAQDQWRLSPHFTLNLGLRYELFTPIKEANRLALEPVIPQGADPVAALLNPNATYDFVGGNANSDNRYFKFDKNNLGPVASFAWTPNFEKSFLSDIFPGGGKSVIRGGYRVSYVNDEFVRAADNLNSNAGLQSTASAVNSSGSSLLNARFNNLPSIAQPTFQVPRSFAQNFVLGGRGNTATSDVIAIDPNLKVSSSTEYNISYQREIGFQTAIEVRYVGGRSNNLVRGTNINQIDILRNGFLADFNRARANLLATGNPFCTGGTCQPLNFFTQPTGTTVRLAPFGATGTAGSISSTTFINNLNAGTPADLALTFVINNAANGFPLFPNPNARDIILLNNSGKYRYNSLQMEFRRRFAQGLAFQANYTFQKTLTDAQGVGQSRIDPLLDINRPQLDYVRADYDQTHVFNFNGIYELPVGKGKRFLNQGGVLNQVLGGWQVTGIVHLGTGAPLTITDARGTLNRAGRATRQTPSTNLTKQQIKDLFRIRRVANGVLFVDPSITSGGRGANGFGTTPFNGQVFFNAPPGDVGNLERAFINGPKYFDVDAAIFKTFPIGERLRFIIRGEAFNLLNRANFFLGNTTSVNSVNFGRITQTLDPRVVQLAGRIEF